MSPATPTAPQPRGVELRRRALLGGGVGAALAGSAAALTTATGGEAPAADPAGVGPGTVPFHGPRQAGVVTPPPAHTRWVALDLARGATLGDLRRVLRIWTEDLARMTQARPTLADHTPELTSEPADLTVTVGLGRSAFVRVGRPDLAPPWLVELPSFPTDALEERWSGGDLVLQICSQSPVAVSHAVRRLVTGAAPMAVQRWVQRGFRDPLMDAGTQRMRNLFGQVDGTVNPSSAVADDDALIWDDGSVWRQHATGMVVRRIDMDLDGWDRADRRSREHAVGRRLSDGAPLTGGTELSPPDLEAVGGDGFPVIDTFSHMRRAMPQAPHERFLRRPYSYDDAPEAGRVSGTGLLFIVFAADPVRQFLPVQRRLAEADLMNIWTTPVGSAVYAVLPGCAGGEILGGGLLA